MSTTADLVTTLKKELKAAQMTYADLAMVLVVICVADPGGPDFNQQLTKFRTLQVHGFYAQGASVQANQRSMAAGSLRVRSAM